MLELYCDYQPVGWREFGVGGFAKGVLQGLKFRAQGEDSRVGKILEFEGSKWVVCGVSLIAGREFLLICNGEDSEYIPDYKFPE